MENFHINMLFLLVILAPLTEATSDLSFYSGTLATAFYDSFLSGNSAMDTLYNTFNVMGILAVGAALFAASGRDVKKITITIILNKLWTKYKLVRINITQ